MAQAVKQHAPTMSLEEYLFSEEQAVDKREYHQGHVYSMAGGSDSHAAMQLAVGAELLNLCRRSKCSARGPDIKLWVEKAECALYADASVICGQPLYFRNDRHLLINPTLIVEVLSPSTRDYDLSGKFDLYKKIPSFREYLLVEPDEIKVIHYAKEATGRWSRKQYTERKDTFGLRCLAKDLRLSRLYPAV